MPQTEEAESRESPLRSALKAVSWRIIASGTTLVIAYLVTGSASWAVGIAGIELVTKLIAYYVHERAWQLVPRGTVRRLINRP